MTSPPRAVPPPTSRPPAGADASQPDVRGGRRRAVLLTGTIVGVAAVAGSLLSNPDSRWYRSLDLPDWQPPALAFPVVWTTLYVDIALTTGLAAARLRRDGRHDEARALVRALAGNMALNAAWSGVFFTAQRPGAATAVAGGLALGGAGLVRRVSRADRTLATLLAPYPAWCAFATVLSAAVARRNP